MHMRMTTHTHDKNDISEILKQGKKVVTASATFAEARPEVPYILPSSVPSAGIECICDQDLVFLISKIFLKQSL